MTALIVAACLAVAAAPQAAGARGAGPTPSVSAAPLVITTTRLRSGEPGVPYSFQLLATGGTGTHRWSIVNDPGADYNRLASTPAGRLTATPQITADLEVDVTVTDAAGATASLRMPWRVVDPLTSAMTSVPMAYRGTEWVAPLASSGGARSITWTLEAGTLPPGISLSFHDWVWPWGATYLVGTPTAVGSWPVTLRATDEDGRSLARSLTIEVVEPAPPDAPTWNGAVEWNRLRWSTPTFDGGAPITEYVITPYLGGVAQKPVAVDPVFFNDWTMQGLQRGREYTYTVAARNRVGVGPASVPSAPSTFIGAPDAPTGLVAVAGDRSATLSWTAPFDGGHPISRYEVQVVGLDGGGWSPAATVGSETHVTVTGLTPGKTYEFAVRAAGAGESPYSGPSNRIVPYGPAQRPTDVDASPGDRSAHVRWVRSARDNGSPITGYRITPAIDGVAQAPFDVAGSLSSATVPGLLNGTTYTFTVAARNGAGPSLASEPSNPVVPSAVPVAPSAPRAAAGLSRNGSAQVSWTAPRSNGGSPITGYVVTPYLGTAAQPSQAFASTATSQTVTGLADGSAYTFRVAAVNLAGTGATSDPSGPVLIGSPAAPTQVTGHPGATTALVSWTVPASNGAPITGFVVTPFKGDVAQPSTTVPAPASSARITGLEIGEGYRFRVAAVNSRGVGASSDETQTVDVGAARAPTSVQVVPRGISAVVSWPAPGPDDAPVADYWLIAESDTAADVPQYVAGPATSGTITGLTPGATYRVRILVFNDQYGAGDEVTSEPFVVGRPDPVTAPRALPGNGTATVVAAVPAADAAPVASYRVTPVVNGAARPTQTFPGTSRTWKVTGLANGTVHTFRVVAVNPQGTSSPATTVAIRIGVPRPSINVTARAGRKQATVSWADSANNGAAITRYVVTPYRNGVAQPSIAYDARTKTRVLTGLTTGASYTFTVRATNGRGTSEASVPSAAVRIT